jgi:hypothetical protein
MGRIRCISLANPMCRYAPYRNATLAKWHNKTTLASGGLAMSKQLKAINQVFMVDMPTAWDGDGGEACVEFRDDVTERRRLIGPQGILAQVEYMLGDRDKLLARTQLKRVALRPLGKVARDGGVPDAGEEIDKVRPGARARARARALHGHWASCVV